MVSKSSFAWPAIACLVLASCRSGPEGATSSASPAQSLVVGSDLDNRPFAFIDERGAPRGRDVEMMEEIARALDRAIVWRRMPFAELLPAAEAGTVDVVCATLGKTPERAERVLFSRTYYMTKIAVVARVGKREPRNLADLAGKRVAAGPGTTSERAVRERLARAIGVFETDRDSTTRAQLLAREIDAAVLDGPAADALVAGSAGALVRLEDSLGIERYALAFPRSAAELCDAVDFVLARMQQDRTLARLDAAHGVPASFVDVGELLRR